MSGKIRFGTDGWRAIMDDTFNEPNVARLTIGLVDWIHEQKSNLPKVVIGYDCRRNGRLYSETVAKVLLDNGVSVILAPDFVTTPMVSLATRDLDCLCGVVITASHNPPEYNGYKLKCAAGGPMQQEDLDRIEVAIPDSCPYSKSDLSLSEAERLLIQTVDLEAMYLQSVEQSFDLDAIRSISDRLSYDAMYGAGQSVMRKILPDIEFHHCEVNQSFGGFPPEPILRNLGAYSLFIAGNEKIKSGLVTDGDADRIGMFDSKGGFIDSHHLILLLIHYLSSYKKKTGKCVTAFSTVDQVSRMCEVYGLPLEIVKIGFKYASRIMMQEEVMLAGEESGGIALKTHIPERDGIWMGLTIWEFMAKTGKSIDELIEEVYSLVGRFVYKRRDLRLDNELKAAVVEICTSSPFSRFGDFEVSRIDDLDGWKFRLAEGRWVMIRPSGTEPVLRVYAQAENEAIINQILDAAEKTIRNSR